MDKERVIKVAAELPKGGEGMLNMWEVAEWIWGKDNVKLLWGFIEFDTGEFTPRQSTPTDETYIKHKHDTEQRLCFLRPETEKYFAYWQAVPGFNNLDECFEWLEPPLYERFGIYHIGFARVKGVGYNCYMNRAAIEYPHREEGRSKELMTLGHGKTLGEAFYDATLKVINRYPDYQKGIIEQLKGQSK